jgi:hypothetical protein
MNRGMVEGKLDCKIYWGILFWFFSLWVTGRQQSIFGVGSSQPTKLLS